MENQKIPKLIDRDSLRNMLNKGVLTSAEIEDLVGDFSQLIDKLLILMKIEPDGYKKYRKLINLFKELALNQMDVTSGLTFMFALGIAYQRLRSEQRNYYENAAVMLDILFAEIKREKIKKEVK